MQNDKSKQNETILNILTQKINWDKLNIKLDGNLRPIHMINKTEEIESTIHDMDKDISKIIFRVPGKSQKHKFCKYGDTIHEI